MYENNPRRKLMKKIGKFLIIFFTFVVFCYAQTTGKISGIIQDNSGRALPGANIIVTGGDETVGAAANIDGEYIVTGVPEGTYTIKVSYIGYQAKEKEVRVVPGQIVNVDFILQHKAVRGETVEITAQAVGQMQAINQQIASDNIKNIVSSEKIQALPEANAAEAVGRLPGVSLKRSGGEGNKVVLRGLSPQYSSIQIDGVDMASTDSSNRSSDVSMISPYMLQGIEVSKTIMADQNAGNLGGIVNFKINEAPEGLRINAVAQGGYNSLRSELSDYNYVLGGSNRFFNNKLGVYLKGFAEKRNRSENYVWAGYTMLHDTIPIANNMSVKDVRRIKNRKGGTVVLDYSDQLTNVKLLSMYNDINIRKKEWEENYNPQGGGSHNYSGNYDDEDKKVMVNSLTLDHYLGDVKMHIGTNYSLSESAIPDHFAISGTEAVAFSDNWNYESPPYLRPSEFKRKAKNDTSNILISSIWHESDTRTWEEQYSADIYFEWAYKLSNNAQLKFKAGGKYRHKEREYDRDQTGLPIAWGDYLDVRVQVKDWLLRDIQNPDARQIVRNYNPDGGDFPYAPFIDRDYESGDFMAGDYNINRVPNIGLFRNYYHALLNADTLNGKPVGKTDKLVVKNLNRSIVDDYWGGEDYYAAYLMPTLKMGKLTFIPGVRYEKNITNYSAIQHGPEGKWNEPFAYDTASAERENDFIFPMIHTKYNLTENFDVRASYTKTLSRPSYGQIVPKAAYWGKNLYWNNPQLEPAKSNNYDVYLTYAGDKSGLITVGGFYKNISGFIYNTTNYLADSSDIRDIYLDLTNNNAAIGGVVYGNINNPNDAKIYGLEFEWQTNFWFLPGLWKNIVFNANYTYIKSELTYPLTGPRYERVKQGFIWVDKLVGEVDKSYSAPLIDQPDHTMNITLGYDYKGFTIRSSMQYISNVFIGTNFHPELRRFSDPITFYDLKIQQKLPVEGLRLYINASNVTETVESNSINGNQYNAKGWISDKSYYGMTADVGIRYNF